LFTSEDCWGSGCDHFLSKWLADAMLHAVTIDLITVDDICFGIDDTIWDRLVNTQDPLIRETMHKIHNHTKFCKIVPKDEANTLIFSKFRGIDPWVDMDGKLLRLTDLDADLKSEFLNNQSRFAEGWFMFCQ